MIALMKSKIRAAMSAAWNVVKISSNVSWVSAFQMISEN
jgi:hypothetical protein